MRRYWRFWLREHKEDINETEKERNVQLNFGIPRHTLSSDDVGELWTRIQQGNNPQQKEARPETSSKAWYWVSAAALVIGVITLSLVLRNPGKVEYRTEFGETRTVTLPDQSTVILNANSRITFDPNWTERPAREVWLEGEAYFSVVHKKNHQSFKVTTPGGVAVEVLGTTFNVYHRAIETKVVLNSGKISLSFPVDKKEKKIYMNPGELVEYKKDKYSKRVVDPSIYAAWTENKIILNQTSLKEMIRMAKDNFGIEIEVPSEKMLDQTVSGSMPIGNADSFVNQIARAFQLRVVHENNKLLLKE